MKKHFRYSKFETLLMAHNWHWVSSMGTHTKINIFETLPVTNVMSIKKSIPNIFLSMTISSNIIIYFVSKIKTVWCRSFLTKNRAISETKHDFAHWYISRIHVSVAILFQNLKTHFHTFRISRENLKQEWITI